MAATTCSVASSSKTEVADAHHRHHYEHDHDGVPDGAVSLGRRRRAEEGQLDLAVGDRDQHELVHGERERNRREDHLDLGRVAAGDGLDQVFHLRTKVARCRVVAAGVGSLSGPLAYGRVEHEGGSR
jgi:hypothetical protein